MNLLSISKGLLLSRGLCLHWCEIKELPIRDNLNVLTVTLSVCLNNNNNNWSARKWSSPPLKWLFHTLEITPIIEINKIHFYSFGWKRTKFFFFCKNNQTNIPSSKQLQWPVVVYCFLFTIIIFFDRWIIKNIPEHVLKFIRFNFAEIRHNFRPHWQLISGLADDRARRSKIMATIFSEYKNVHLFSSELRNFNNIFFKFNFIRERDNGPDPKIVNKFSERTNELTKPQLNRSLSFVVEKICY